MVGLIAVATFGVATAADPAQAAPTTRISGPVSAAIHHNPPGCTAPDGCTHGYFFDYWY